MREHLEREMSVVYVQMDGFQRRVQHSVLNVGEGVRYAIRLIVLSALRITSYCHILMSKIVWKTFHCQMFMENTIQIFIKITLRLILLL